MALPALGPKLSSRAEVRDKVIEASLKATAWTASALRKMDADDAGTRGRLKNFIRKWFGKHSDFDYAKEHVREVLSGTLTVLSNMIVRKGGGRLDRYQQKNICTGGVYAYVYPGQQVRVNGESRYVVNLCDFTLDSDDWVLFGGTLVHEASHHVSTYDWQYGLEQCEELAKKMPMYALTNADSLEYFVDDLVANFATGIPKTWVPPLEDNDGNRWNRGEEVEVRDGSGHEWKPATVLGIKHGVLVVHVDGTDHWRFAGEARSPPESGDCSFASMGDLVYVKDMAKHEWKAAYVVGVDDAGDLIAQLAEPGEEVRSKRHERNPWKGWKYCIQPPDQDEWDEEDA